MADRATHIMLDFFGTLVGYSADEGYQRSYGMFCEVGGTLGYDDYLAEWMRVADQFHQRGKLDEREYSMADVADEFLRGCVGPECAVANAAVFGELQAAEWNVGVRYLDGLAEMLSELRTSYRLAVVSNTNSAILVPDHLRAMGLADLMDAVVLSVEVGWRKPNPAIYRAAVDRLGADPSTVVFVGDTYEADYLGPERLGMRPLLIDPDRTAPVPDDRRLATVLDLAGRLLA